MESYFEEISSQQLIERIWIESVLHSDNPITIMSNNLQIIGIIPIII